MVEMQNSLRQTCILSLYAPCDDESNHILWQSVPTAAYPAKLHFAFLFPISLCPEYKKVHCLETSCFGDTDKINCP